MLTLADICATPAGRDDTAVTLALCTECGTARSTTTRGGTGEAGAEAATGGPRCMLDRRCATCRRTTAHAYIRTDAHRDHAEQAQAATPDPTVALTGTLCALGVHVEPMTVECQRETPSLRLEWEVDRERELWAWLDERGTAAERASLLELAIAALLTERGPWGVEWSLEPDYDDRLLAVRTWQI